MTIYGAPARVQAAPPAVQAQPDISLIEDDLYGVLGTAETMGFVHRAGNVYVALSGNDAAHCVEVGQSLSFDEATSMVQRAFRAHA